MTKEEILILVLKMDKAEVMNKKERDSMTSNKRIQIRAQSHLQNPTDTIQINWK